VKELHVLVKQIMNEALRFVTSPDPVNLGRLLAARLLAVGRPDAKPRHFGDAMLTGETTFTGCLF
jgi:hypothetical protein